MIYTTKQGDMWDSVAYEQMGSGDYTGSLMEANPGFLNTFVFSAGVELTIPEIPPATAADLPPWRKPAWRQA